MADPQKILIGKLGGNTRARLIKMGMLSRIGDSPYEVTEAGSTFLYISNHLICIYPEKLSALKIMLLIEGDSND